MSRSGSHMGMLDTLHANNCDGQEFTSLEPVVVPAGGNEEPPYYDHSDRGADIEVVRMVWCGECGAADWEVV